VSSKCDTSFGFLRKRLISVHLSEPFVCRPFERPSPSSSIVRPTRDFVDRPARFIGRGEIGTMVIGAATHRARWALPLLAFCLILSKGIAEAGASASEQGVASATSNSRGGKTTSEALWSEPNDGAASAPEKQRSRGLDATYMLQGDTTSADVSSGNPASVCGSFGSCINGCRSLYYKVTGGVGGMITATTCGMAFGSSRIYVWQSSSAACGSFACTGAYPQSFPGGHDVARAGTRSLTQHLLTRSICRGRLRQHGGQSSVAVNGGSRVLRSGDGRCSAPVWRIHAHGNIDGPDRCFESGWYVEPSSGNEETSASADGSSHSSPLNSLCHSPDESADKSSYESSFESTDESTNEDANESTDASANENANESTDASAN
jgi:hypothetical protein